MTPTSARSIADETIAYWRATGVSVATVSKALRCHHSWESVRYRMVRWLLDQAEPERRAA